MPCVGARPNSEVRRLYGGLPPDAYCLTQTVGINAFILSCSCPYVQNSVQKVPLAPNVLTFPVRISFFFFFKYILACVYIFQSDITLFYIFLSFMGMESNFSYVSSICSFYLTLCYCMCWQFINFDYCNTYYTIIDLFIPPHNHSASVNILISVHKNFSRVCGQEENYNLKNILIFNFIR